MGIPFYDSTPFEYGYSSKKNILSRMNPNLKEVIQKSTNCDKGERKKNQKLFARLS